jgi:hypothetical protein
MSGSTASLSNLTSIQVTIYLGIPLLITGIIGGILNIIVFLSLKTFRKNSCAFYLTIMSIVNIGNLITGLLSRIMISGFNMDWTQSSIFYCKFRPYCLQSCTSISFTCMCLATIDQFLSTCSNPRWQRWSNIKIAHRLTIIFIILWLLHGIPFWIYYNQIKVFSTGKHTCIITNQIFQVYVIGIQTIGFYGFLTVIINTLFGLLAYRNIRDLTYRTIPLVRRELDKQLTKIVLIQAVYNFIATIPYLIVNILTLNTTIMGFSINSNQLQFANILTVCIFYLNFSVSDNDLLFFVLFIFLYF